MRRLPAWRWVPGLALLALLGADYLAVREGVTPFDPIVLLAFRVAGDPGLTIGPAWLAESARDLTGLGSNGVTGLLVFAVAGGLILAHRRRLAAMLITATVLALALNAVLKVAVHRLRPDLVPGAPRVFTTSFPSSHAMVSAAVFFTLATILAGLTRLPALRLFAFVMAALGTLLIGLSRIYLGVHWPTDVIGGWAGGLFCAWLSHLLLGPRSASRGGRPAMLNEGHRTAEADPER